METQTEIRKLPVQLTDEEIAAKGRDLAAEEIRRAEVADEAKEAASDYREVIKGHDKAIQELSKAIDEGTEERDVECRWEFDDEQHLARLVRNDTDADVLNRALTAEEQEQRRQASLFPRKEDAQEALAEVGARIDEGKLTPPEEVPS